MAKTSSSKKSENNIDDDFRTEPVVIDKSLIIKQAIDEDTPYINKQVKFLSLDEEDNFKLSLDILEDVSLYLEAIRVKNWIPTKESFALFLGLSTTLLDKVSNPNNFTNNKEKKIAEKLSFAKQVIEDMFYEKNLQYGLYKVTDSRLATMIASKRYGKDEEKTINNSTNILVQIRQQIESNNK